MHRLDSIERHNEVARVLDVHDELRATHRGHLADSTKLFAAIGDKGLKSHLDVLVHDPSPSMQPAESPTGPSGLRSIPRRGRPREVLALVYPHQGIAPSAARVTFA